MPTDKKYTASYLIGTGTSTQNLQALQEALVQSGEAGIASASRITQGLESIETGSDKALGGIAGGSEVSDAALRKLAAQFVSVQDAAVSAFGSIEAAPEAIKTAMATAEQQILAVNTSTVAAGEKVDQMAAQFAAMGAAAAEASGLAAAGGSAVMDAMTAAADATTAAIDSVDALATGAAGAAEATQGLADSVVAITEAERALDEGNVELLDSYTLIQERVNAMSERLATFNALMDAGELTARASSMAVKRLAVDYQLLGTVINEEFGSVAAAGEEVSTVYRELGLAFTTVKASAGEMALSVRLAADEVAFASGKALNAEKAFAMMAGSMGPAVVQGFLFASMAGIAVMAAEKLAQAVDSDAHAVDAYKESFAGAATEIKHSAYDIGAAVLNLIAAQDNGNAHTQLTKDAFDDLGLALYRLAVRYKFGEEAVKSIDSYSALGLSVWQMRNLTFTQATAIQDYYNKTLANGVVGERERDLVIQQSHGDVVMLVAAIKDHVDMLGSEKQALDAVTATFKEQEVEIQATEKKIRSKIEAVVEEMRVVNEQIQQYGTEADAEQKLFDLEKKRIDLFLSLEMATKGQTKSLVELENVIKDHLQYGERYSQQLAGDGALMSALIAKTDDLTAAERARLMTIAESAIAVGKNAGSIAALTAQIDKETDALFAMKGADDKAKEAALEHIQSLESQRAALSASAIAAKGQAAIQDVQSAATAGGTKATDEFATATTSTLSPMEQVRAEMVKIEAARKAGTTATKEGEAADTSAAGAAKHHADELSTLRDRFHEVGDAVKDHLIVQLDATKKLLDDVETAADKATKAIVRMSNAANSAGEGGAPPAGGITYPGVTEGQ